MKPRFVYSLCTLGALVWLVSSCSPIKLVDAVTPDGSEHVSEGARYGALDRQRLDVYRPEAPRVDAPVVMFFYGGSWKNGSRGSYSYVGESLASLGYTVVIPDYRVYPEVRFPAFVEDGALALAWVQTHVPEAASGVVLMGHSAGAHIAALLALDGRYQQAAGVESALVRGWVGLAGPYAFRPLQWEATRAVFEGLSDENQARPIHFACGRPTPALLLHGDSDDAVLPEHSRRMAAALEACNTPFRLEELADVNHFDIALGLSSSLQILAEVLDPVDEFITGLAAQAAQRQGKAPAGHVHSGHALKPSGGAFDAPPGIKVTAES
jgi:acetyl esterase/lipase